MFSNKVYNILKWIAMIFLPAIGSLYFGLAGIWGLPFAEEVVGTITVIDAFLGVLLGISTNYFNKKEEVESLYHSAMPLGSDVSYWNAKYRSTESKVPGNPAAENPVQQDK